MQPPYTQATAAAAATTTTTTTTHHHLPHTMPGRMIRSLAEYGKIKKDDSQLIKLCIVCIHDK
jgi:hypothetical protein